MLTFQLLKPASVLQRVPKNGVASSEQFNDFMEQSVHDFAQLFYTVNNTILPILNGLGAPGSYAGLDPVTNGLDGTTLLSRKSTTSTGTVYFWNSSLTRPKTVAESLDQIVADLNLLFNEISQTKLRLGGFTTDGTVGSLATLAEVDNKTNYLTTLITDLQGKVLTGSPAALSQHLNSLGTGVKTTQNPHAMDVSDLTDNNHLMAGAFEGITFVSGLPLIPSGSQWYGRTVILQVSGIPDRAYICLAAADGTLGWSNFAVGGI